MDFILSKLFTSLLNMCSDLFVIMIEVFVDEKPIISFNTAKPLFEAATLIAMFIFFMSVLKDIFTKFIEVDGSVAELKIGSYIIRIIGGLIIIMVVNDILMFLSTESLKILLTYISISKNVFDVAVKINFLNIAEGMIVVILSLLISLIGGLLNIMGIIRTKAELFLIILLSPIACTDSYNSIDKLNGLISKFIGLHIAIGVKITMLGMGLHFINKSLEGTSVVPSVTIIKNTVIALVIFFVGSNPASIVDLITAPKTMGSGLMQGANHAVGLAGKTASLVKRIKG